MLSQEQKLYLGKLALLDNSIRELTTQEKASKWLQDAEFRCEYENILGWLENSNTELIRAIKRGVINNG